MYIRLILILNLNPFITETVHLPRKLVRGQDVWLGKGAEQTRQILKCMWCGQSFRSLAEMTSHMQQTQHYTNIISQEQLISWRSSEDKSSSPNSHVSAVLTCKVCDQVVTYFKPLLNNLAITFLQLITFNKPEIFPLSRHLHH